MIDSQEYRDRAQACIRMAESSANPQDRKTFSELAAIWLRLANEMDTTQALVEHWGDQEPQDQRADRCHLHDVGRSTDIESVAA
jgi:hypothetical protein